MKLYYAPGACSLAAHIIIREAGLDVAIDKVTFGPERLTESGKDYYSINPMGAVPALELDDGELLTESAVLLQYLAHQKPEAGLAPEQDGMERWRFLETLNFIATELHKGFSPLFAKPSEEWKAKALDKIGGRFDLLQQKLGDNDYLAGKRFTILDAYAYVPLNWALKFNLDLARWPKLNAYFERLRARPSVQQALREEGLPTS